MRYLIIFLFVIYEVYLHVLLPNLKDLYQFVQIFSFLHLKNDYLAYSKDKVTMTLIDHAHAVEEYELSVSELNDQLSE
jgi:hypothetical protein